MAATVTFDGTRVNDSTSNTNWGNWGSGGGAPSSEPQLAYQGGSAVNTQVKTTSLDGIDYDPGSGAIDMTAAAFPLWFVKVIVSDAFDVNTTEGVRVGLGSAAGSDQLYNLAGSGANRAPFDAGYPAQAGYILAAINPNIAAWIEVDNTATLTAIDWFGAQCAMVTGGAKSENLALDAIDLGRGLYIVGTSVSLGDTITTDQDVTTNRWGVVRGSTSQFECIGLITAGANSGGTAQVTGTDTSIITFPDGYHGPGDVGFLVNLGTASTDITLDGLYISNGLITTSDTRADLVTTGTSGSAAYTGQWRNFRNFTMTSAASAIGAAIECQLLTQASADIENCIISTNAITQVACLQDPTFGSTTDLHDTEFVQTGVGHAIELDTATTYTFTNLGFTDYGGTPGTNLTSSSGANDAAILNSSGGAVTINISGGDVPSVRNTAGSTTTVVATVNYTVNGVQNPSDVTILDRDVSMLDLTGTAANQNVGDVTGNTKVGQSFQVAATGKAERIRLNLRKVGAPTDGIHVSLVSGNPGGTEQRVSGYIDGADLTTSYVEYDMDLQGRFSLSTSTDYGIEFERSGANDGSNYYQIEYSTASVEANGERWLNNGTWSSSTGDLLLSVMESAGDNQLHFADALTTGTTTYAHGGVAKTIEVIVSSLNFRQVVYLDTIGGTDKSQAVAQIPDLVYSNP